MNAEQRLIVCESNFRELNHNYNVLEIYLIIAIVLVIISLLLAVYYFYTKAKSIINARTVASPPTSIIPPEAA